MSEGHVGLSNEKAKEGTNGEFSGAPSYLKVDQRRAYFVIHVYSNTFDYSRYLQRSNVRGRADRPNFLERLGFAFSDSCNILPDGRCYYQVIEEVDRDGSLSGGIEHHLRMGAIHDRFDKLMMNIKQLYDDMAKIDRMLLDSGIKLPWEGMGLASVVYEAGEKVYEKGQVYDFYKDIREITQQARNEVFLIDAYPDEEVLNLYLGSGKTNSKESTLTISQQSPK